MSSESSEAKPSVPSSQTPVPLAIIGIGCLFPKADGVDAYWANIRDGVDAITDLPESHWKASDYFNDDPKAPDMTYGRRGGFLSSVDFNPLAYGISPNNLEATDTAQLLGLWAADQALQDAGYGQKDEFDRDRVSVIMGVTGTLELVIPLGARLGHPIWRRALQEAGVDENVADDVVQRISDSYVPWQENSFPGLLGNVVAGRIANRLNLGGTNCVVDAACASSLGAIHLAGLELAAGRSDMVVTGGVDTFNDIFMYMCFSKTPALSPTGNAKPFDKQGDGTILGEGVGVMVLKRFEDAQRDGDRVYAVIKSMGSSSDGKGGAIYAPRAEGQQKALRSAYSQAGVHPSSIDMVEAHGTGTVVGDATELSGLASVFEEEAKQASEGGSVKSGPWCAVGSVKSQIGHTKAAAGSAGIIKAALALHHKVLPPTIKIDDPQDQLRGGESPFYLNTQQRPWLQRRASDGTVQPRRAGVSSFGFGGSNFHCVLEEAQADKQSIDWDGRVQVLAFSAETTEAIREQLNPFAATLSWKAIRYRASRLRKEFKANQVCRLLLVVEQDQTDVIKLVASALKMLEQQRVNGSKDPRRWRLPEGAYFASGVVDEKSNQVALLFPGQGSQYTGMLRELACRFPQFSQVLADADEAIGVSANGARLTDSIYPPAAFSDDERAEQDTQLRRTDNAQPALGAVSLGAWRVLEHFGVSPKALAGHSYGELAALCAAGVFDVSSLTSISRERGRLMAGLPESGDLFASEQSQDDRGCMLAVQTELQQVEEVLKGAQLDLVIANRNAPKQFVLSGAEASIDSAVEAFKGVNVRCKKLPVAAAFHSSLVADAETPFKAFLKTVSFADSQWPVYSNTTAKAYPKRADARKKQLAGQLARPVEFIQEVENMYKDGARVFIEVGPGARLTGLVDSILGERTHSAVALDASSGGRKGMLDLAHLLANCSAEGLALRLDRWDEPAQKMKNPEDKKANAMAVSINGANFISDKTKALKSKPRKVVAPAKRSAQGSSSGVQAGVEVATRPTTVPTKESVLPIMNSQPQGPTNQPQPVTTPVASPNHGLVVPAPALVNPVALQAVQQNMATLQQIQTQTAQLHKQFLEGQQQAVQTIQMLITQQPVMHGVQPLSQAVPQPVAVPVAVPQPVALQQPQAVPVAQVAPTPVVEVVSKPVPVAKPQPVAAEKKAVASASAAPSAPAINQPDFKGVLLTAVGAATGYPVEMLELDMELDADLGIDSIKRVEILSAVQEALPNAPAVESDQLGSFRTLRQITDYFEEAAPGEVAASVGATEVVAQADAAPVGVGAAEIERYTAVLLETVAAATGYPPEMLELEMELDSDLGIDSIKRVEILSALQEKLPGVRAVGSDQLGSFRTLQQIVDYLSEGTGEAVAEATAGVEASVSAGAGSSDGADRIEPVLMEIVAEKTGYPVEMLNMDMELEADLGIDSIKRVEILAALQEKFPEAPTVQSEDMGALQSLNQIVSFLVDGMNVGAGQATDNSVAEEEPAAIETLEDADDGSSDNIELDRLVLGLKELEETSVKASDEKLLLAKGSTVWIVGNVEGAKIESSLRKALEKSLRAMGLKPKGIALTDPLKIKVPKSLGGVIVVAPPEGSTDAFLKQVFLLVQRVAPALRADKEGSSVFATVSRLDGCFGLNGSGTIPNPVTGGLAGLAKTVGHEWPQVKVKALDLPVVVSDYDSAAQFVINELFQEGPVEVGFYSGKRYGVELTPVPFNGSTYTLPIKKNDLVVISGGARGVTAEVSLTLAKAIAPTLLLLGRSAAPAAEPEWLSALASEADIKRELLTRSLKSSDGKKSSPKEIEEQFRKIKTNREMLENLAAIEAAGAKVLYRQVDVRNGEEVKGVVAEVQKEFGPVRGVVHGAGVLADRLIEEKTEEQFDLVYGTKVSGLRALLSSLDPAQLKVLVLFSSSTGRFGRKGQVDYAVANEVLNKIAQQHARLNPECRVVSVNWGPWDGGMVTGGLRKVFEKEGVGLINLRAGADYLMKEISTDGDSPVEVTVLGRMNGASSNTGHESMVGSSVNEGGTPVGATAFERVLELESSPVLKDHVLNGRPVLPMALMAEWLNHAALHGNPGLIFKGMDDLTVLKGVVLEKGKGYVVRACADVAKKIPESAGEYRVAVELWGHEEFASNDVGRLHAKATVVLGGGYSEAPDRRLKQKLKPYALDQKQIYSEQLFHGPSLQGIVAVEGCANEGIVARVKAAPVPATYFEKPIRGSWLTDPLVIDSAFQLMILWSLSERQAGSLPFKVGRYRQFRKAFPKEGCRVAIRVTNETKNKAEADIEFLDDHGRLIACIEGYACTVEKSLADAFRKNVVLV